jgi:hypothetical protein
VQAENFLGTLGKSPWGQSPAVQQFVTSTRGALPSVWKQAANFTVWLGFTGADAVQSVHTTFGVGPDVKIPGMDQVKIP